MIKFVRIIIECDVYVAVRESVDLAAKGAALEVERQMLQNVSNIESLLYTEWNVMRGKV